MFVCMFTGRTVEVGMTIAIAAMSGQEYVGEVTRIFETAIEIKRKYGTVFIPREGVKNIWIRSK